MIEIANDKQHSNPLSKNTTSQALDKCKTVFPSSCNASSEVRAFMANLLDVDGLPAELPEFKCDWVIRVGEDNPEKSLTQEQAASLPKASLLPWKYYGLPSASCLL